MAYYLQIAQCIDLEFLQKPEKITKHAETFAKIEKVGQTYLDDCCVVDDLDTGGLIIRFDFKNNRKWSLT